jgi:hypothetical protein
MYRSGERTAGDFETHPIGGLETACDGKLSLVSTTAG